MIMRKKIREDNRGIALISVMICVMLCFLLSATILRISLLSYLQKGIGKQASSTFYENESFVDDIKLGVQQKVALAFAQSSSTSQALFIANFRTQLLNDGVSAGATATEKEKLETALRSYITNSDATRKIVSLSVEGDGAGNYFVSEGDGEVVIKGIKIEYIDNSKGGYVSNIKTDIRVRSPFYITTETETESSGGGYSVVASNGAIITSGSGRGNLRQGGNLYFGYKIGTVTAKEEGDTWVVDHASAADVQFGMAYWMDGDNVIFNGDITVDNSLILFTGKQLTVRGTIYLNNTSHLVLGSTSKVKCKDIVVEGESAYSGDYTFADDVDPVDGPPIDFDGENSSRSTWFSKDSSIDVYNGNGDPDSGETRKKASKANIEFDQDIHPVANVSSTGATLNTEALLEGDGEQYDYQFYQIIDVAYMNAITDFGNKTPKGYISTYDSENEDGSGKWSNFSGYTMSTQEFPTIEGKTLGLNFGNNVQTINNNFGYIMINWSMGEQTIGTLNINSPNTMVFYGMMFTRGSMTMKVQNPKLGLGISFVDYYDGDVDKAKRALKYLGRGITTDSGINQDTTPEAMAVREKNCINNMFRNGIISVLDEEEGGGETIITTENDQVRNKTLEVVTFENWVKY